MTRRPAAYPIRRPPAAVEARDHSARTTRGPSAYRRGLAISLAALAALPCATTEARPVATPSAHDALFGLRLGMPIEAAIRQAQSLAPPGSVTLPAVRREAFSVVAVEAPADAMPAPVKSAADPRQENFYLSLNAAPRVFKKQPTRSSHTGFVTLVADQASGRVVRIVIEPAFVRWTRGLDAEGLAPQALAQRLQERLGLPSKVVNAEPAAFRERPWAPRPPAQEARGPVELRVNAQRGSVVVTDPQRLPDALATRWELD